MARTFVLLLILLMMGFAAGVEPSQGKLLIIGGGSIGPAIWKELARLAGGFDAPVVYVPTASENEPGPDAAEFIRKAGFTQVSTLHTRDPKMANEDSFAAPLTAVKIVFFGGGRQWRIVDSYAGTKTEKAFLDVLKRGGVVAGTSAGASIQASYLVRGARENNFVMMAPAYEKGFGYLPGTAIDQHLLKRNRANDLWQVIGKHPELLGIGIDESTAISVEGSRFTVLGASLVAIYDAARMEENPRHYFLSPGTVFDLAARKPLP
jgi:cyanophycinase